MLFLVGCSQEESEKDDSFGLKAKKGDFPYGEVYKVNKKNKERDILRVYNDELLFGVQENRFSRNISFYWLGKDLKIKKTKKITISGKAGEREANLKLGVQGWKEFDMRNDDTIDSEGIFNFSGVYFDLYNNGISKSSPVSTELPNGNQVMGCREDNNLEDGLLVIWDKNGKLKNKLSVTEILGDARASCDSIEAFGDYVYIFSKETKAIYQLTNELQVVKNYDLSSYLSQNKLGSGAIGEFVYQAELEKWVFYLGLENGDSRYFDVNADGVSPWDFSNPTYKDKYITIGYDIIDMGGSEDGQDFYSIGYEKAHSIGGGYLNSDGDFYFKGQRDLTKKNPKEEEDGVEYLIKVKKDKLKAFLEKYGEDEE